MNSKQLAVVEEIVEEYSSDLSTLGINEVGKLVNSIATRYTLITSLDRFRDCIEQDLDEYIEELESDDDDELNDHDDDYNDAAVWATDY